MNQTEKVARWCNEYYGTIPWDDMTNSQRETWLSEAEELCTLIDQQAKPVGWVSSYQLEQVASDPRISGVVTTLYKHKPEGTTFHVPLYLHPPASQEGEALLRLRTEVNCRIEHGAESGGHLEFVQEQLDAILDGNKTIDSGPGRGE